MRTAAFALVALALALTLAACSRAEDEKKLIADMATFQEAIETALQLSPDEAGIKKAEALVAAQSGPLHARYTKVDVSKRGGVFPTRCAGNGQAIAIGEGYVKNALVKRGADEKLRAELLARTGKLKATLETICTG